MHLSCGFVSICSAEKGELLLVVGGDFRKKEEMCGHNVIDFKRWEQKTSVDRILPYYGPG